MKSFLSTLYSLVFLSLVLCSCGGDHSLKVRFINHSDYNIRQLQVKVKGFTDTIALARSDTTQYFVIPFERSWAEGFAEPGFMLWPISYVDHEGNIIEHKQGVRFSRPIMEKNPQNNIIITTDSTGAFDYDHLEWKPR